MLIRTDNAALPAPTSDRDLIDERRSSPRVSLVTEIAMGSDSNFFTGFTNDVSNGGVFVATFELLPVGSLLDLSFALPGGARIAVRGEVRWVRELDAGDPDVFPGLGIGFVDLPPDAVRAIQAFTAKRDPLFFPDA